MRDVMVVVHMQVDDEVTDEMIDGWLPSVAAQVDEPVYCTDESGNDGQFTSHGVMLDLYIDGTAVKTVP